MLHRNDARSLRVLMVCARFPPYIGGTEAHVSELSCRLAARGHEVSVLTTVLDPTEANEQVERGYIRAHILITVAPKQMPAVVQALHEMPQVRSLHSVSGAHDLVAMGVVPTVVDMDELTDRIGALDGVERTTSAVILSTKFER